MMSSKKWRIGCRSFVFGDYGSENVIAVDGSAEQVERMAIVSPQCGLTDQHCQTLWKRALVLLYLLAIWLLLRNGEWFFLFFFLIWNNQALWEWTLLLWEHITLFPWLFLLTWSLLWNFFFLFWLFTLTARIFLVENGIGHLLTLLFNLLFIQNTIFLLFLLRLLLLFNYLLYLLLWRLLLFLDLFLPIAILLLFLRDRLNLFGFMNGLWNTDLVLLDYLSWLESLLL